MSKVSKIKIVTINYDNLNDLKKTIKSVDNQKTKPQKHIIISRKLKLNQKKNSKKVIESLYLDKTILCTMQ